MNAHASEEEQVEALKNWWKENGSSVVTGVLLGLSVLLGGKAWFSYQESQQLNASNIYAQMMAVSATGDSEQVKTHANVLITEFTSSVYAPLAAMLLAKQAVESDELSAAQAQLEWALDKATTPAIEHTARTRLVRVMIDQAQYAQAEVMLDSVADAGAYQVVYNELRGDLAVAQGEPEKAAAAYEAALSGTVGEVQGQNTALLSAKLESVSARGEAE
jgi:predicted negative regulator of RcsB-dependent stress response